MHTNVACLYFPSFEQPNGLIFRAGYTQILKLLIRHLPPGSPLFPHNSKLYTVHITLMQTAGLQQEVELILSPQLFLHFRQ